MTSIPQFHRSSRLARRRFLQLTAGTILGATGTAAFLFGRRAWPFAQSPTGIHKFMVNLPGLGRGGANQIGQYLPLLTPSRQDVAGLPTDVYNVGAKAFSQVMHPDLPNPTQFWGYYDKNTADQKYLGGVFVAKRGTPVLFNVTNEVTAELPAQQIIPIDLTLDAGENQVVGDLPLNRITPHLHGGDTPWFSDGTPFQWFTPATNAKGFETGPSFMNVPGVPPMFGAPANYYYPMNQSARFVWYHDHAMGLTRTNVYVGLASGIVLNDDFEMGLVASGLLPDSIGIPLVIQDKTFIPDSTTFSEQDPTWPLDATPGHLWYPHVYEPNQIGGTGPNPSCAPNDTGRWDYGPCVVPPAVLPNPSAPNDAFYTLPTPSVVAEAFFDTTLVNGGVYPLLTVPPKRVRFRILNAAQARFYHLNLYPENPAGSGEVATNPPTPPPGGGVVTNPPPIPIVPPPIGSSPVMYQIGTEGGFLPAVARLTDTTPIPEIPASSARMGLRHMDMNNPLVRQTRANPDGPFNLLLAPAERADVIIDFNGRAGQTFILYNDAPAPFPSGDDRNDYYTGAPDQTQFGGAPTTLANFGPNTRTLMRIVVSDGPGDSNFLPTDSVWLPDINMQLQNNFVTGNQPGLLFNNGNPWQPGQLPYNGPVNRMLTLNEDFDDFGRLIQRIGTFAQNGTNNQGLPTWGLPYMDPPTEEPAAGSIEVWQIWNLTADTHPMHFHLVNVQVIQRQVVSGDPTSGILFEDMNGNPTEPFPPDANEIGWKDTVRMNGGELTTVIMQWNLPNLPTAAMRDAMSPRTGGHEYVWHCHILEHEEHDMMRPVVVR